MEERLKGIFANVNEWLKFAETKNAAIIAADAAALFGALTLILSKDNGLALWLYIYLHSFIFFVVLSALAALLSVIPKTKILQSKPKDDRHETDNLLFYGHIAKYTPDEYLTELRTRYEEPESKNPRLEFDYAQQITINSQITLSKYNYFSYAIWFAVAGILTPILAVIAFMFIRPKNKIKPKTPRKSPSKPVSIEATKDTATQDVSVNKADLTSQPHS
ncbi:MAG: hypothetical protein QOG71_221 [Pyrinomonadaceae bacterium]|nr:hypothetical protein [Pyrinomonadaceae bacterium]